MNVKKLVMSGGMLAFVAAVVIGGTGAFFSDTASSTGNVFTAGDVSLTLGTPTHEWLGSAPTSSLPANYFSTNNTGGVIFGDLKPGDYGRIANTLTTGSNDSFICARIVTSSGDEEFAENLRFRTGTGPGGSFSDIVGAPVPPNAWFSPTAPADNLTALPLPGGTTNEPIALEYCFGEFVTGGPGCTVPNPGDPSWNVMQLQSLGVDVEFFAIQQRNNENFTCDSLNPSLFVETGGGWSPESAGVLGTNRWVAKARFGDNNPNAGAYELEVGFGPGQRAEENAAYVSGTSQPFTLAFDNTSKIATITVGNYTVNYTVAGVPTAIGITAKGDATRSTALTNVTLNSESVADVVSAVENTFASLTGPEVSGDFILSGDLTLTWGASTNDENPALQIDVLY